MPAFAQAVKSNASFKAAYRPVAVFVGGTSGIGQATAERFAHHTKGNAHIIICGRNQTAAEKIISGFPQAAESKYEFVPCADASLLKNVVETSTRLKSQLSTINYLVLSQGIMTFQGRTETTEGLDIKMTLHFYSRFKFVDELLPLLQKASESGQDARVMSVLGAGAGGKVNIDDLGLKNTYSLAAAGLQVPTYNDLFVEEYGKRHPNVSFIHISPGAVSTPLASRGSRLLSLAQPIFSLLATSPEKCGEWMLSALWSDAYKAGNHHVGSHGEPIPQNKTYTTDEAREKLVEHYNQAVSQALST